MHVAGLNSSQVHVQCKAVCLWQLISQQDCEDSYSDGFDDDIEPSRHQYTVHVLVNHVFSFFFCNLLGYV